VLDRTKTRCGARLLRASLLQPLRDIDTLNARWVLAGWTHAAVGMQVVGN